MSIIPRFPLQNEMTRISVAGAISIGLHFILLLYLASRVQQPIMELSSARQGVMTLNLSSMVLSPQAAPAAKSIAEPAQTEAAIIQKKQPPAVSTPVVHKQKVNKEKPKKAQPKARSEKPGPREKSTPQPNNIARQSSTTVPTTIQSSATGSQVAQANRGEQIPHSSTFSLKARFRRPPATPVYPQLARQRREEGTVLIAIKLDNKGKVQDISLLRSSGHTLLDREALRTAKKWQFMPPELNGVQQTGVVQIPVRFKLT